MIIWIIKTAKWHAVQIAFLCVAAIVAICSLGFVVFLEHNCVWLGKNVVRVPDDWIKYGRSKIQYKVCVPYENVRKIDYRWEETDSHGHRVSTAKMNNFSIYAVMSKPYIILTDDKGKLHRIYVFWYSKWQRRSMIRALYAGCPNCEGSMEDTLLLVKTQNGDGLFGLSKKRKSKTGEMKVNVGDDTTPTGEE